MSMTSASRGPCGLPPSSTLSLCGTRASAMGSSSSRAVSGAGRSPSSPSPLHWRSSSGSRASLRRSQQPASACSSAGPSATPSTAFFMARLRTSSRSTPSASSGTCSTLPTPPSLRAWSDFYMNQYSGDTKRSQTLLRCEQSTDYGHLGGVVGRSATIALKLIAKCLGVLAASGLALSLGGCGGIEFQGKAFNYIGLSDVGKPQEDVRMTERAP